MPDTEKQEKILQELKRRAKEMRYGSMTVELKIIDETIVSGEIVGQKIKLG